MNQPSVPSNITPLYFFSSSITYFGQKEPIKEQIFDTFKCSGQNSSNSSYQFWNDRSILLQLLHLSSLSRYITPHNSANFKFIHFLLWIKESDQSCNFWDFWVLWWKFVKFLMSFSKSQISYCSNFASLFSVMKDKSYVPF